MPITRVLRHVPDSEVDQVVSDFESEGCDVTKERETDGNGWKVTAACPGGQGVNGGGDDDDGGGDEEGGDDDSEDDPARSYSWGDAGATADIGMRERLAMGHLYMLTTRAGLEFRPVRNDTTRAVVSASRRLTQNAVLLRPRVDILLTTEIAPEVRRHYIHISLSPALQAAMLARVHAPRLLVAYVLPAEESAWMTWSSDTVTTQRCAYWASRATLLEHSGVGVPQGDGTSTATATDLRTARIPLANRLTSTSMRMLLAAAAIEGVLPNGLR